MKTVQGAVVLGVLGCLFPSGFVNASPPTLDMDECLIQADALPAGMPRFQDHPARPVRLSKPAPVDLRGNPAAQAFRTRLRLGATEGPNFAGHYTVVAWGCGAGCIDFGIVDAVSGKVFFDPSLRGVSNDHVRESDSEKDLDDGVDRTTLQLRFRRDSQLLIVFGTPNEDSSREGVAFYRWTGRALQSVRFIPRTAFCGPESSPSPGPSSPP
jgi:hypothetical protein